MNVLVTCKYEDDPIKNEGATVFTTFSHYNPFGSYPLPWTLECQSDLAQNLMQPFPNPNDGSDEISVRLAHRLRRYSSLKMFTHRQTHTQTTARLLYYKLTFERINTLHKERKKSVLESKRKDKIKLDV